MSKNKLKLLAVADPAVMGYVDKERNILRNYPEEVQIDIVPWDTYYPAMTEVFEGKTEYDIVMVAGHLWKRDFVEKGYLREVEFSEEDILPVISREMKYAGKYYLSPSFCDGHMIVYRKSIMRKVLGYELKDLITPQEYIEAAEKLWRSGYKIAMKAAPSEIFTDALPFLRMNGRDVYDSETGRVQSYMKYIADGLESYCALKRYACENTENFGNDEVAGKIKNKEAAMAVTWSGQLGVIWEDDCMEKEDLGFATFKTAWNVTWSFAVSCFCKQEKKANKLLEFLRSPETDRFAGITSGAPVRRESYEKGAGDFPWYTCQLKMFEHASPLPDLLNAGEKNGIFYAVIHRAFTGEISPEEAMNNIQKAVTRL